MNEFSFSRQFSYRIITAVTGAVIAASVASQSNDSNSELRDCGDHGQTRSNRRSNNLLKRSKT